MRNFGMGGRLTTGGQGQPSAIRSHHASDPVKPFLPRSDFSQAMVDVFEFLLGFSVASITGIGIAFVFIWIFFV